MARRRYVPALHSTIVVRSSGGFAVSGSHNYQKNGTYTVAIQVSDAGGSITTTTITIVVI